MMEQTDRGVKYLDDNGDSWIAWVLLPGRLDDDEAIEVSGLCAYYGGVGRPFAGAPIVRKTNTRTLVSQMGGWDI